MFLGLDLDVADCVRKIGWMGDVRRVWSGGRAVAIREGDGDW